MAQGKTADRFERWARVGKTGEAPVAAATVILIRDGDDGLETLMLRRNSKLVFGGMWVFPGGRVEADDRAGLEADDVIGAARRAASREAEEEAGLRVIAESMIPFSHWTPPPIAPKRFHTWFFIAPAGAGEVAIDGGEIHDHAWMPPAGALRRRDAREIELAPPTWVTLRELSGWRDVREALSSSRARTPERYSTRVAVTDEGPVALWHGDAGYEQGDASLAGARHRLAMGAGVWEFERRD